MPDDYQRVAEAIHFLRNSALEQPSLEETAQHIGLSPYHFQRLFRRFSGVSPKRFLQHLSSQHAKQLLQQSTSVLETSFAVGLSGPGRLHDLLVSVEAVTPGEYKSGGIDLNIEYAIHPTPFGRCFIAVTERGICRLEFIEPKEDEAARQRLRKAWPNALLKRGDETTQNIIQQIFNPRKRASNQPFPLLLRGTNFQLQVWQALLKIPEGCVTSYGYLAGKIGHPKANRAVGTAIGNNPISYLIPCHRVLRADGQIGGYRWGTDRKLAILGTEFCKT
ncbi:MAG: methylated-DNA--[protein]-cysteine S-methyltransferase [Deltaproteobacteria bacterium]|nr:methylated-DNA--[protein]-cysteine S-methyltransferase [Deltaproteobacteria bacterium]